MRLPLRILGTLFAGQRITVIHNKAYCRVRSTFSRLLIILSPVLVRPFRVRERVRYFLTTYLRGMSNTNKESRRPTDRYASCDWYYDIPLKRSEEQVSSDIAQQPKSQIPGLGDFGGPHHDITFGGRRKWIKDTDSEYVKLAKQGGRPDLLRHFTSPRKVSPYCAPESHHSKQAADNSKSHVPVMPDYMIHEEFNSDQPIRYKPKRGPFDFDTKSIWQRDAEDKENQKNREENDVQFEDSPSSVKKKIKLPAISPHRTEQNITSKFQGEKRLYFPRMPPHKKNEPVNFSKLISSGYGDEWLQQRDQWEKKNTLPNDSLLPPSEYQKKIEKRQKARKDTLSYKRKSKSQSGLEMGAQPKKSLFKLRTFRDVPARIDTNGH